MTNHTDYRRVKESALQQLAAAGDQAAVTELQRRGVAVSPDVDVTRLDHASLCQLVQRWQDGVMPDERARNFELAERAHAELGARYRVDLKFWDGRSPQPQPPLPAPWLAPRPRRCQDWRRPQGSTLYPSEVDRARAEMSRAAREVYAERGRRAAEE